MRIAALCLVALALAVPAGTACGGLITNGDFESGNTGFATQYTYTTDLTLPRTIVVGVDPQFYNSRAVSYRDHTSGYGSMLIANGAVDSDITVWQQTVSVTPNTQYVFCYWLSTWAAYNVRLAEIKCQINGVDIGVGFAPETPGEWTFIFYRWNSGANSQAIIRLVDRSLAEVSNDFAIDDIDMFDVGDNCLLVTYATRGGSVVTPGEGVFLYPQGASVDLEARCDSGYEFASWGGNFFDVSHLLRVDMSTDRVAIAQFKKLDYAVNIRASGVAPSEFATCEESVDRLSIFQGALDSLYPSGWIVGQRKGICSATYLFPILKPQGGVRDITKLVVNVYGMIISAGAKVKVGSNPAVQIMGDLHQTFTGQAIADLLGDCEEPVCWLPVRISTFGSNLDLASVYVSYDCPSIPRSMLRRFHDHLSIYQALEGYARAQDIRDLYNLRAGGQGAWEAVVQTSALAEDLAGYDDTLQESIGACVEGLDDFVTRWQQLGNSSNPALLAECRSEAIVTCLDEAVSSGQAYIAAYAAAVADGRVLAQEASELNRNLAEWKADMVALNATMTEVFRALGEAHNRATTQQLRDTAERMIRAMTPWLTGEPDDFGVWVRSNPTYLEEVIETLQDFPAEDVAVP